MTRRLVVPGAVYYDCLDPRATDVPADSGWPPARLVRRGYGVQAVYEVTTEVADAIIAHVLDFGNTLSFGVDPETAAEARRCVRWAEGQKERQS